MRPTVVGLRRYDTPSTDELRRWFGPDVELIVFPREGAGRLVQIGWMAVQVARRIASGEFEVLHLHSSFAGAVGRLLVLPFSRRIRTFYSPHGFAFLRTDLRTGQRRLILLAEQVLARVPSTLVLVSASELEVAHRVSRRAALLENGVDLQKLRTGVPRRRRVRPVVAMVGRITEQKAPWRFALAASRFADRADFRWLGYGPPEDVQRWLGDAPVSISGRLDHAALLAALQEADIVYFPTLWEGMPLSLIEAQGSGLPVVASDIEGNRDIVIDGVTGFLRTDEEDLLQALGLLIDSVEERERMGSAASEQAQRFSDDKRGARSIEIYLAAPG